MPTMLLCMNPMGGEIDIDGIRVKEPTFGLDALWINSDKAEEAELYGLTVVDRSNNNISYSLVRNNKIKST